MKTNAERLESYLKRKRTLDEDLKQEIRKAEIEISKTKAQSRIAEKLALKNRLEQKINDLQHQEKTKSQTSAPLEKTSNDWRSIKPPVNLCMSYDNLLFTLDGPDALKNHYGFSPNCAESDLKLYQCDPAPNDVAIADWAINCKQNGLPQNRDSWGKLTLFTRNGTTPSEANIERLKQCFGYNDKVQCTENVAQMYYTVFVTIGGLALIAILFIYCSLKRDESRWGTESENRRLIGRRGTQQERLAAEPPESPHNREHGITMG